MFLLTMIQNLNTTQLFNDFVKDLNSSPYLENMNVNFDPVILETHKYEITYVLSMGLIVFLLLLQQLQNHRLSSEVFEVRKQLYRKKKPTDFEKDVKTLLLCLANRTDVMRVNFTSVLQELETIRNYSHSHFLLLKKLSPPKTQTQTQNKKTQACETGCDGGCCESESEFEYFEKVCPDKVGNCESESDSENEEPEVRRRIIINRPNKYGKNYKEPESETESDEDVEKKE